MFPDRRRIPRNIRNILWRAIEIICYIITGVAFFFCLDCFIFDGLIFNFKRDNITYDNFGNFGDFMAGFVGSLVAIVSMYLLFRTFKAQRSSTDSNNILMITQRFNDLFFRLLDLYHNLLEDLIIEKNRPLQVDIIRLDTPAREVRGKNFLDEWRNVIINKLNFIPSHKHNVYALRYFKEFYAQNSNKVGAYFRTIYRILNLIDTSPISEEDKKEYSKILRAQFSESELFMMFFNSQTRQGKKLGLYLWKYHILKHLPIYSIPPFNNITSQLTLPEKEEFNHLYDSVLKITKDIASSPKLKRKIPEDTNVHFRFSYTCEQRLRSDGLIIHKIILEVQKSMKYNSKFFPHISKWSSNMWVKVFAGFSSIINVFTGGSSLSCRIIYKL